MKNDNQLNGLLSPLMQRIRIKKTLPFLRGPNVLDIGSSNGELIPYLPADINYFGVEGDSAYYEKAKALFPDRTFFNFYIDYTTVDKLVVPPIDTVVMAAVLEHLDNPENTLIALKAYLAPRGRIIITTPNKTAEKILRWGAKWRLFSSERDEHKRNFSKKDLYNIASSAGYKIFFYARFEFGLNNLAVMKKND